MTRTEIDRSCPDDSNTGDAATLKSSRAILQAIAMSASHCAIRLAQCVASIGPPKRSATASPAPALDHSRRYFSATQVAAGNPAARSFSVPPPNR